MDSGRVADDQNKERKKVPTRLNRKSQFSSYLETKRDKLHVQFDPQSVSNKASSIFKGISCYFTGVADSDELRELLIENGGRFDHFLSKTNTSHIISDQLAAAKKNTLKNALIVKSDWIRDCIKAGKVLPTGNYLLFKQSGIMDLLDMASKTTISVTSHEISPPQTNGQPVTKDDATQDNEQAQTSTSNCTVNRPIELASSQANVEQMDIEDQMNEANNSAGLHSLEGKNLATVTVSINNVRCTVYHTLQKYIGEISCQLHIRLRELTLKGKSLTLTVAVKKQGEKDATNKGLGFKPIKGTEQEAKTSYDQISRSTILDRYSNDVTLINSYTNGLMSTMKSVQIAHIKSIKLEMHNLEKCTEEEISEWKIKAAAKSIPTFTTPLKSDLEDEVKDPEKPQESEKAANRDDSDDGPPPKRLSVETGESKHNKSPKKSPAKSPAKKSKGKASAKPDPKSKFPGTIEMFFQKAAARAALRENPSDDVVIVTSEESNEATTSNAVSRPQSKQPKSLVLSSVAENSDPTPVLREWVIIGSEIHPEDVEFVTKFLSSLVQSKDWSKLKSCIEALYEVILEKNQIPWKKVFNSISACIYAEVTSLEMMDEEVFSLLESLISFELIVY